MTEHVRNVLFLCTGNSARSILGEALLNHLAKERVRAFSAGSKPGGRVNPFALEILEANRIATSGLRSKSWDEFERSSAPASLPWKGCSARRCASDSPRSAPTRCVARWPP